MVGSGGGYCRAPVGYATWTVGPPGVALHRPDGEPTLGRSPWHPEPRARQDVAPRLRCLQRGPGNPSGQGRAERPPASSVCQPVHRRQERDDVRPCSSLFVLKDSHLDLCVLRVATDVLDLPGVVIADRNAASGWARFDSAPQGLAAIDKELVFADWWNQSVEAKQVRWAEVLVPNEVPPRFVLGAYVSCEPARQCFDDLDLTEPRLPATINERMFYKQGGRHG